MKILHLDLIGGTSVDSTQLTLQRSLVTEPVKTDTYYIEINQIWKWAKSIGLNVTKRREQCVEDTNGKRTKQFDEKRPKILADTDHKICAEIWTKLYLQSIGSSGVVHSVRTGKHPKFIMCNIRDMNICKKSHEDYFYDSTIYVNLEEKQFSVRCNGTSCTRQPW
jgi:hypothetical protein